MYKSTKMSELVPRDYQLEMFTTVTANYSAAGRLVGSNGSDCNYVLWMDTGSGKTLIAAMVAEHLLNLRVAEKAPLRKVVFLVSKVLLCEQQAKFLAEYSSHRVGHYHGQMGVDYWNMEKWRQEYDTHDVIVATAQVFFDTLKHAYISLDQVGLIIFDECHHAKNAHPYNQILQNFYRQSSTTVRPYILGLTASPVATGASKNKTQTKLATEMNNLLSNLDATVLQPSIDMADLDKYSARPDETIVFFHPPSDADLARNEDYRGDKYACVSKEFFSIDSVLYTIDALGPWCLYQLVQMVKKLMTARQHVMSTSSLNYQFDLDYILELDAKLSPLATLTRPTELWHMSSQVQELLFLLKTEQSLLDDAASFCCIVFVERRYTAQLLADLINLIYGAEGSANDTTMVAAALMGENLAVLASGGPKQKNSRIVGDFGAGKINVLVATSVAEEGLDIQPCRLVVRFNPICNLISYVQSRGRARHRQAKYLVMQQQGDENKLQQFKQLESDLRNDAYMSSVRESLEMDLQGRRSAYNECYEVASTGAKIPLSAAITAVHQYCDSLPRDEYCTPALAYNMEESNKCFRYELKLPTNAPLKQSIIGPYEESKMLAKQKVSLDAIRQLHQLGALSDNLLPVRYRGKRKLFSDVYGSDPGEFRSSLRCKHKWRKNCKNHDVVDSTTLDGANRGARLWSAIESDGGLEVGVYSIAVCGTSVSYCALSTHALHAPDCDSFSTAFIDGDLPGSTNVTFMRKRYYSYCELRELQRCFGVLMSAVLKSGLGCTLTGDTVACSAVLVVPRLYIAAAAAPPTSASKTDHIGDPIDWSRVYSIVQTSTTMRNAPVTLLSALRESESTNNHDDDGLSALRDQLFVGSRYGKFSVLDVVRLEPSHVDIVLTNPTAHCSFPTLHEYLARHNRLQESFRGHAIIVCKHQVGAYHVLPNQCDSSTGLQSSITDSTSTTTNVVFEIDAITGRGRLHVSSLKDLKMVDYIDFIGASERHALSLTHAKQLTVIPLLLDQLDRMLTVRACQPAVRLAFTDEARLLEALTTPKCRFAYDYERLETLGDAVLKLLMTLHVSTQHLHSHEGTLSIERDLRICNTNLLRCGLAVDLVDFAINTEYTPRTFLPNGYRTADGDVSEKLSDKTVADLVESCIGAYYLDVQCDLHRLWHDVLVRWNVVCSSADVGDADSVDAAADDAVADGGGKGTEQGLLEGVTSANGVRARQALERATRYPTVQPLLAHYAAIEYTSTSTARDQSALNFVQTLLNYTFRTPVMALEALTHISYQQQHMCYERLEFLGDAVLGMVATEYLFHYAPALSPGQMTDWRSVAVSNDTLGCVVVDRGLHLHIRHDSEPLQRDLDQYLLAQPANRSNNGASIFNLKRDDDDVDGSTAMNDCSATGTTSASHTTVVCPKVLGDVLEALLGAVFVDSDGDMRKCTEIVNALVLQPYVAEQLRAFGGKSWGPHRHPVSVLNEAMAASACKSLTVAYDDVPLPATVASPNTKVDAVVATLTTALPTRTASVSPTTSTPPSSTTTTMITANLTRTRCTVLCHDVVLSVSAGRNKKEARKNAAVQLIARVGFDQLEIVVRRHCRCVAGNSEDMS